MNPTRALIVGIVGVALSCGWIDWPDIRVAASEVEPGLRPDAPPTKVDDLNLPGELFVEGFYDVTFNGMDSGSESFRITRDGADFVIGVIHRPGGGPQSPFAAVVRYGPDGGFRSATQLTLTAKGGVDEYRLGDGGLQSKRGEAVRTTEPRDGWVAAYPTYVDDFALLTRLGDLAVGARVTPPYYTFDSDFSWAWGGLPMELTRLPDRAVTRADGSKVTLRQYQQSLAIPGMQEFLRTTVIDERGLPVKITIKMSFGTIEARLRGIELP